MNDAFEYSENMIPHLIIAILAGMGVMFGFWWEVMMIHSVFPSVIGYWHGGLCILLATLRAFSLILQWYRCARSIHRSRTNVYASLFRCVSTQSQGKACPAACRV
jgi:hypothetical protein